MCNIRANDIEWIPGKNDKEYIEAQKRAIQGYREVIAKATMKIKAQSDELRRFRTDCKGGVLKTIWETPKYCKECGEHLSLEWSFCPECGKETPWAVKI